MKKLTLNLIIADAEKSELTKSEYTDVLWVGLFRNKNKLKTLAKELNTKNLWYEVYHTLNHTLFNHITYQVKS